MASREELKGIGRGLYESGIRSEKRFIFNVLNGILSSKTLNKMFASW
jgi:hypothetical protein